MQNKVELLPCPFCGGKAKHQVKRGVWRMQHSVGCIDHSNCPGYLDLVGRATFSVGKLAVDYWNMRHILPQTRIEVS